MAAIDGKTLDLALIYVCAQACRSRVDRRFRRSDNVNNCGRALGLKLNVEIELLPDGELDILLLKRSKARVADIDRIVRRLETADDIQAFVIRRSCPLLTGLFTADDDRRIWYNCAR